MKNIITITALLMAAVTGWTQPRHGDSAGYDQKDVEEVKKETGIKDVTLLHTKDLKEANSKASVALTGTSEGQ